MTNDTVAGLLDNARKRKEELRLESEALDSLIAAYEKLLRVKSPRPETPLDQFQLWDSGGRKAQAARIAMMIDEAKRIILAEKRPMKRGELVAELAMQGLHIVGGDKNKVFGTNLWRSKKFRHVDGYGYWPIDVPVPREFESPPA